MSETALTEVVEVLRTRASGELDDEQRSSLGQYLTPAPVASLIASMVTTTEEHVRLLEPGAGAGSLIAATVEELCKRPSRPKSISVTAYEIDPTLAQLLPQVFELCRETCLAAGVEFTGDVIEGDFIEEAVRKLQPDDLFKESEAPRFNLVVTNPPYRKLNSNSFHRALLRTVGVETSNLYAAFLALATLLLESGGEVVAITPRSFCNGTYFRPFRQFLLDRMAIQRVHVFDSRKAAFKEDAVLQENIIFRAVRDGVRGEVDISSTDRDRGAITTCRTIQYGQLVSPNDREHVIHLVPAEEGQAIADVMRRFTHTLKDLGITVSTGRVVDFRAKDQLRSDPEPGTAPLIYPTHLASGRIEWPKSGKKPNALLIDSYTRSQLVPNEDYVLVKRFSAKEERRRVVAVVFEGATLPAPEGVGFENHINYFHRNGRGLDLVVARGLATFLNSTLVDQFFRQFSGHTQVNAGDLRMLPYPCVQELVVLGAAAGESVLTQLETDQLVATHLLGTT